MTMLRFIMAEVGKGLNRNRAMSLALVIVTFVSLLFVGVAALAQMQVTQMKSQWYDKVEVSIYMCALNDESPSCNGAEATAEQIEAVRSKLASPDLSPLIREVYEESKEEAYKNFTELYRDTPIGQWTTAEMLPVSFRIKLVDPTKYEVIAEEFSGIAGVAVVKDQRDLVEPLFQLIEKAMQLSLGLAGVMTIAAVLLITTTIRLSALSRERETSIMRLVGASSLFIQAPFMIEGALAAVLGALLAVVTLFAGVHFLINGWLAQAFEWTSFIGMTEVWIVAPLLVGAALMLALVASAVSLARYTKV
ncbi:MAG: permease-like cell division protein FtsX [Actinomycetaceae bacterium]|nr:permease-like cell division protein FtsX [Actinomycetaceae bacterium]